MTWLVTEARVLASAEVATKRRAKGRGLLGRDHLDGAFVLPHCRWIHTIGMRFPIDVGYLDHEGVVVKIATVPRHRLCLPVRRARTVIEAQAGAFARWGLREGCVVELREGGEDEPCGPDQHIRPNERRSS